MKVQNDTYELVKVGELTEHPDNPRRGDMVAIKDSMETHGFVGAIIAQRSTGRVLAGNHRLKAAKEAGAEEVPVLWLEVDDEAALRILLADNKTSDDATYDPTALQSVLRELLETEQGLLGSGYAAKEVEALLAELREPKGRDGSRESKSMGEHLQEYEGQAKRVIVLDFPLEEYKEVSWRLAKLREELGVDSNSAAVKMLLEDVVNAE